MANFFEEFRRSPIKFPLRFGETLNCDNLCIDDYIDIINYLFPEGFLNPDNYSSRLLGFTSCLHMCGYPERFMDNLIYVVDCILDDNYPKESSLVRAHE